MFYYNRKGIGRNFLITLIVVLASFGVMLYVTNYFVGHAEEATVEQICRTSVLARAKSVIRFGLGMEPPSKFPLLCKTQEKPPLEGDKDEVMRQISEMSAKCWSMFLEGEYHNLFGKADFLSKRRCFTCYTFNIKKDMKITREELIEYMNDHYYTQPNEKGEGGLTYLDYIQSYKGDGMVMMRKNLEFTGKREQVYSINPVSYTNLTLLTN